MIPVTQSNKKVKEAKIGTALAVRNWLSPIKAEKIRSPNISNPIR
jgi:hypothetical protein